MNDIKKNFSLKINNIEYIGNLLDNSLNVSKNLDDFTFDFKLNLLKSTVKTIGVGAEVILREGTDIIAGGILYEINTDTWYNKNDSLNISQIVDIKVDDYTNLCNKILTKKLELPESEIDINLNYAENLYLKYFNTYLLPYNFTLGDIKTNLTIDTLDLDTFKDNMSLKEVFEALANLTHSHYKINTKKEFIVYRGISSFKTLPDIVNEDKLQNLTFKRTLEGYRNRVTVIGGEASGDIAEQYINEDGKLFIIVEDKTEQDRIKTLIGGDGIFASIETNDNITNLEELENQANLTLNKYSRPPVTISFNVKSIGNEWVKNIEAGDFIKLKADTIFFNEDYEEGFKYAFCCVDSIEITDEGGDFIDYKVNLSKRKDNTPQKGLLDILQDNSKNDNIKTNGNQDFIKNDNINIQIQSTITTSAELLYFDSNGNPI